MTYTEEEALNKWCPHAVASHTDPRAGIQPHKLEKQDTPPLHNCIGSRCMSWRAKGTRQEGETLVPNDDLYSAAMSFPSGMLVENNQRNKSTFDRLKEWDASNKAAGHVPLHDSPKMAGVPLLWIEREVAVGFCGLAGQPNG